MTETNPPVGPYASMAPHYFEAGWAPLPVNGKGPPPVGFTGANGRYPTAEDVARWMKERGAQNLALRLPPDVIGLDYDAYKDGADETFAGVLSEIERHGIELPPTLVSSARDDRQSGIRLFRVRPGLAWRDLGPGLEVIRADHRYAVVWPSIHPELGMPYRWRWGGETAGQVLPEGVYRPDQLAYLPDAAQDVLMELGQGRQQTERTREPADGAWTDPRSDRRVDQEAILAGALDGYANQREALIGLTASAWAYGVPVAAIRHMAYNAIENFPQTKPKPWTEQDVDKLVDDWTQRHEAGRTPRTLDVGPEALAWAQRTAGASDGSDASDGEHDNGSGSIESRSEYPPEMENQIAAEMVRQEVKEQATRRRRTTQRPEPVDVAAIIAAGRVVGKPPSVMPFVDEPGKPDIGLFYPACYNKLYGASDVGKSKILYSTIAHHVNQKKHVVHLEFDSNHPNVVIWGVVDAGADPKLVKTYLHVFEMPADTPVLADGVEVALVTLDSENPAITSLGHDINASGTGVDEMLRRYITPFTSKGATAVGLDHVGHQDKTRERHTARKKEAVTGISYLVEVHGVAGRVGSRWLSKLTPAKDRPGWGPPRDRVAGYAVIDGTAGDGTYQVTLHRTPPLDVAAAAEAESGSDAGEPVTALILRIVSEAVLEPTTTSKVHAACQEDETLVKKPSPRGVARILTGLYEANLINGAQKNPKAPKSAWQWWAGPRL